MTEIKENGYVRWKPFLLLLGGVLWALLGYASISILSKAEFQAFEKGLDKRLDRMDKRLDDIGQLIRKIDIKRKV